MPRGRRKVELGVSLGGVPEKAGVQLSKLRGKGLPTGLAAGIQ